MDPVVPVHPLPWPNCYLDLTYGSPRVCRVTTAERQYTPLLAVNMDELIRIINFVDELSSAQHQLDLRLAAGSLRAISSMPLPPSPTLNAARPNPVDPALPPVHPRAHDDVATHATDVVFDEQYGQEQDGDLQGDAADTDSEEVSIIASDDEDHASAHSGETDVDDNELDLLLHMESVMNNAGDLHDPVVNVWYDLDMVSEVTDPTLFYDDVERLNRHVPCSCYQRRAYSSYNSIVEAAEIRLGLKDAPVVISEAVDSSPPPPFEPPHAPSSLKDSATVGDTPPSVTLPSSASTRPSETKLSELSPPPSASVPVHPARQRSSPGMFSSLRYAEESSTYSLSVWRRLLAPVRSFYEGMRRFSLVPCHKTMKSAQD